VKHKLLGLIAATVTLALAPQARSAELPLPKDGWASWQVDAVENAEAWCCWDHWESGDAKAKACSLDDDDHSFSTHDHTSTDTARVYARFANGKLQRLRTLAAGCPVETRTPIQKLDGITTDDSARWLIGLSHGNDFEHEVLASLAMHRGGVAFDALRTMAATDPRHDYRKQAVFWLALMRGQPGADIATSTMFNDKDPDLRKHGAFATTLSKSPRVAADLIKLGDSDADGDVRAQAWFWLAHTGAPNAEQAISGALRKDPDGHVQEQAVFALSRLPDERATRALIAVAEDRSLAREQRKRAVFWLAQSKSPDAQAYLEKVLTKTAAR
jgi:hypothetical protein